MKEDDTLIRLQAIQTHLLDGTIDNNDAAEMVRTLMTDIANVPVEKKEPLPITEDDKELIGLWFDEAKNVKLDSLQKFIDHLLEDYKHDYGTICHAVTAGAVATCWAMNDHKQGGITGFQAGAIMWEFIKKWEGKEGGLKLIEYDDMLFPQHSDRFEKTIRKDIWEDLQKKACDNLKKDNRHAHPHVIAHWTTIKCGKVPFGYTVKDE